MKLNQQMKTTMSLAAAMGTLALATSAQAAVIYEHGFGGSDGVNLFGTTVDVDNNGGGNTWSGTDGVFEANGDVSGNAGVWLPFAPTTGNIYQLSATIDFVSGDWITLGFAAGNPDANFNTIAAEPYGTTLVSQPNVTTFDGQGLNGANGHTALSGFNDVDIVLDATDAISANWTVAFYLEGALVSGPSTITNSGTWPEAGDLNRIQYVGFSSSGATIGAIDDFALTTIPEPTTTALLGLGGLALILRRRK